MANAWDALLASAQPGSGVAIDSAPNPEYDNLMGLAPTAGDDPLTAGLKQANSIIQRNTPQGRAMTMEIAKEKLANQMAIQLAQAKIDLAKANPEYDAHTTPWGAVIMTNKFDPNDTHEVGGAAGGKEAYVAKLGAETADANADAAIKGNPGYVQNQLDEQAGKVNLVNAQTSLAKANTAYAEGAKATLANARANNLTNKPLSSEDQVRLQQFTYKKYGIPTSGDVLENAMFDKKHPGVRDQANQEIAAQIQARSQGGGAAVPPDPSQAPDVGSLMNLSNGINPNQGLLGQ